MLGFSAHSPSWAAPKQTATRVWPRTAEKLAPIDLGDLVAAALPSKGEFTWSTLLIPRVHWLTDGVGRTGSGFSVRNGVARVRAHNVKTTVLRQQWEELGWGVELLTEGNAKWGPTSVTIFPGFEGIGSCFGIEFKGCTFPASALNGSKIRLTKICQGGSGSANITAFRAVASDGRAGTVLYHTDAGSGGQTNKVTVTSNSAADACRTYERNYG